VVICDVGWASYTGPKYFSRSVAFLPHHFRIAGVDETSDRVRIHAQCRERVLPVPQTGMAQRYVFQVTLQAPLGGRTVYDGSGNLAVLCQAPAQDCIAPG
jgi:hypothetical protein